MPSQAAESMVQVPLAPAAELELYDPPDNASGHSPVIFTEVHSNSST